jgi:hypothetical protein
MTALVPISDIQQMATAVAKSGLFGIKTPDQGVALMLIAQAEGLHPAIAARDYHVIQGRPALKTDAMLARFQQAGGKVEWKTYTDEEVTGVFSHPQGGSLTVTWTMKQAKSIGLAGKDNWKNYPRAMLRARCISEGIRSVYPGCVVGVYSVEETQDFTDAPAKPPESPTARQDLPLVEEVPAEEEELPVALVTPTGEIYGKYKDNSDFCEAYASLVGRLVRSKLGDEAKKQKQQDLWQINAPTIQAMTQQERTNLRSLVVGEGGTLEFPKSQPQDGTEASESEF